MTIEEQSKYSQTFHKDESMRIFNKDKSILFTEWNYGYCQGYFEAMQKTIISTMFAGKIDKDKLKKTKPYIIKAISDIGKERNKAIEEIKKIIS